MRRRETAGPRQVRPVQVPHPPGCDVDEGDHRGHGEEYAAELRVAGEPESHLASQEVVGARGASARVRWEERGLGPPARELSLLRRGLAAGEAAVARVAGALVHSLVRRAAGRSSQSAGSSAEVVPSGFLILPRTAAVRHRRARRLRPRERGRALTASMRHAPHPASPSLPTRSVFPGISKAPTPSSVSEPQKLPIRARPPRPLFSRGHALSHGRYRDLCVASIARAARLDLCPAAFAPWGRTRDGGTSDKSLPELELRVTRCSS